MIKKTRNFVKQHQAISFVIAVAVVIGGIIAYKTLTKQSAITTYVLAKVEKGSIIATVSGSGQVAASNQVDIKPKASGNIVYLAIKNGQNVKAGTLLAQIDARDAYKAVRDAEINLETARLSMEKLNAPADELIIIQAENSLAQAQDNQQKAGEDLKKAYEDGFNSVANVFLELPAVMSGLYDIIYGNAYSPSQQNIDYYGDKVKEYDSAVLRYKDITNQNYQLARTAYDKNFADYKSASRYSDNVVVEKLINDTYETVKNISESVKSANNLLQFYEDKLIEKGIRPNAIADTALKNLNSYTGTTNAQISSLLSIRRTIQNSKDTIINAGRTIVEKTGSLAKLKSGADALDIRSQQISISQRQNALADAREKLADYYIRAPFDGLIAKVNIKKGDLISSGTALATLVGRQSLADISLNEVDIAKIKVGQQVTLQFDAVAGLSLTGKVIEVDALGTVTQGVVNYNVKIGFDTEDERVKPGMSVSVAIIIDAKQNILLVPNSAVKTQNGAIYVEMIDQKGESVVNQQGIIALTPPREQIVETGLSNDSSTEIISGLKEGDEVIERTVTSSTTASSTQQAPSLFGGGANRSAGGGIMRMR